MPSHSVSSLHLSSFSEVSLLLLVAARLLDGLRFSSQVLWVLLYSSSSKTSLLSKEIYLIKQQDFSCRSVLISSSSQYSSQRLSASSNTVVVLDALLLSVAQWKLQRNNLWKCGKISSDFVTSLSRLSHLPSSKLLSTQKFVPRHTRFCAFPRFIKKLSQIRESFLIVIIFLSVPSFSHFSFWHQSL